MCARCEASDLIIKLRRATNEPNFNESFSQRLFKLTKIRQQDFIHFSNEMVNEKMDEVTRLFRSFKGPYGFALYSAWCARQNLDLLLKPIQPPDPKSLKDLPRLLNCE